MQYSASLLLINAALWIIMFIVCKPGYVFHPQYVLNPPSLKRSRFLFLLLLLTSIFAFSEHDFYHTWYDFNIGHDYSYYEPIYEWLAYFTNEQYYLWRLVIWGAATLSLFNLAKRLNNLTWEFLFTTILILPISFYIATRGSAGYAILLWSVIWLLPNNEVSYRKVILGVGGIFASFFLHRSMSINIALALIALVPIKLNKKFFVASLIAFPFLVGVVNDFLFNILSDNLQISFGEDMDVANKVISYADGSDEDVFNLHGIIGLVIVRSPLYLMLIYCIIQCLFNNVVVEPPYTYMLKLSYVCIYAGLLFAFQDSSIWFYQRITFMGLFPLVFVFSRYLILDSLRGGYLRFVFLWSLFSVAWYFILRFISWS